MPIPKVAHPIISIIPTIHVWEERMPKAAPELQISRKERTCGTTDMLSSPRREQASSFVDKSTAKSKRAREKKNILLFTVFSLPLRLIEVEI